MAYVLRANNLGDNNGAADNATVNKDLGAGYDDLYLTFDVLIPQVTFVAQDPEFQDIGTIAISRDANTISNTGAYFSNQDDPPSWWGAYTSFGTINQYSQATSNHTEPDTWHTIGLHFATNTMDMQVDGDTFTDVSFPNATYQTGGGNGVSGGFSSGWNSAALPMFAFTTTTTIREIVTGIRGSSGSGNLTVSIVNDNAGLPTGSVAQTITYTGTSFPSNGVLDVNWTVPAGTYWLVYQSVSPYGWNFSFNSQGSFNRDFYYGYNGTTWVQNLGAPPFTQMFLTGLYRQVELGWVDASYYAGAGNIYYRNVKVGTTGYGSSDVWSEDFSSGNLTDWTTTYGDVEVVDDSTIPQPGAPPPNDNFVNATILTGTSSTDNTTTDLSGATTESGEPAPQLTTAPYKTAWYSWTAPADGTHQFSTAETNRVVGVYTGASVNSLTAVNTANISAHNVSWTATAGTTYYIQVGATKPWVSGGSSVTHQPFVPAQYDQIGAGYPMVIDGNQHSVVFDNTNATQQTNENTYNEGEPSLWAELDLSKWTTCRLTVSLQTLSGPVTPYADLWAVDDASWDENSPDFSLLTTVIDNSTGLFGTSVRWGDGTQNVASKSFLVTPSDSKTGKFYLFIGDWNFQGDTGQIQLTYKVETAGEMFCIDAVDVANTNSSTVTVSGGVVTDSQDIPQTGQPANNWDFLTTRAISDAHPTVSISGSHLPPDGQYEVLLTFANESGPIVVIKRNGHALFPTALPWTDVNNAKPQVAITGLPDHRGNNGPGPTVVPILSTDTIDICFLRDDTAQLKKICFRQRTKGGGEGEPIKVLANPHVLGGGSQESYILGNVSGPTDDPGKPFNTGWLQSDMVVCPDGSVWVLVCRSDQGKNIRLYKWDGNSWNKIDDDVHGWGAATPYVTGTGLPWPSIDCDNNSNVYVAYGVGDATTLTISSFTHHNSALYVKKYTPGGSKSDLTDSTGIRAYRNRVNQYDDAIGSEVASARIRVSPGGVPWVMWSEMLDLTHASFNAGSRAWLACYQGGQNWQYIQAPDPPDLSGGGYFQEPQAQLCFGVRYITDCENLDFTFCHHDGPNENPAILYVSNNWYNTDAKQAHGNIIYSQWNGSSWGHTIQFQADEVWGMGDPRGGFGTLGIGFWEWWSQGTIMVNDGKKPIIVLALGHTQYGDRGVAGILNDAGTAFVSFSPERDPFETGAGYWSWLALPYWFTTGRWGNGWNYPSVEACTDPDGNLFTLFSGDWWGGDIIGMLAEVGTTDGWIIACKDHMGIGINFDTETERIQCDADGNLYCLQQISPDSQSGAIVVIKYERGSYVPWASTHATPAFQVSLDYST